MDFENAPIDEKFFAGFDKQTLKISHPWPREAEDRVNQLLGQLAEKELQFMRLAEVNDKLQADLNRQADVTEKAIQALNRNADLGERAEADAKKLRAALVRIEAAQALGTAHALAKMALRGFECQDCIGMREHGCYCEAMGAVQPGGPGA